MKDNYETCIAGEKCVLVPYRPEHVSSYHEWMKDPHLLEATGSEPLTLEEEVSMQQSWKEDPYKCTFIVLAREACSPIPPEHTSNESDKSQAQEELHDEISFVTRTLHAMAGDVNLFLSQEEEEYKSDEDAETKEQQSSDRNVPPLLQAELDIMIAQERYRGNGLGREASCLMMQYGAKYLGIRRYFCKVNEDNLASRALFEALGFTQCNYAAYFRQVELELKHDTAYAMLQCIQSKLDEKDVNTVQWYS